MTSRPRLNNIDMNTDQFADGPTVNVLQVSALQGADFRGPVYQGSLASIPVNFLVDTGASHTFIAADVVTAAKLTIDPSVSTPATVASGDTIQSLGSVSTVLTIDGMTITLTALVLPTLSYDIILGYDTLRAHDTVIDARTNTVSMRSSSNSPCILRSSTRVEPVSYTEFCTAVDVSPTVDSGTLTPTERETLLALLNTWVATFAVNPKAPGPVHGVELHIDVGQSRPIKCVPY
jgi:predicted aspartyl protease